MGIYTNLYAKEFLQVLAGPRVDGLGLPCEYPSLLVPVSNIIKAFPSDMLTGHLQ